MKSYTSMRIVAVLVFVTFTVSCGGGGGDSTPAAPARIELDVVNGAGDGTYNVGSSVRITADPPAAGEEFAGWTGNVSNVAAIDDASTTVRIVSGSAITVTATYQQIPVSRISTPEEASRFLAKASFGPSIEDINALVGMDADEWLRAEFDKPMSEFQPAMIAIMDNLASQTTDFVNRNNSPYNEYVNSELMLATIRNEDQLRMRMMFALSQIVVVGGDIATHDSRSGRGLLFLDALLKNSFGNYRNLLEEVTLTPAMAEWLTYINNEAGDPSIGREPDENYARELLQLFAVGLVQLNPDGTPVMDSNNQAIEIYDNEDISKLARVFTGYSYAGVGFGSVNGTVASRNLPLELYSNAHDQREKSFMGIDIPAGTSGEDSLQIALDGIMAHDNVPPFVSRQLIQRFTASHPTPEYVARVSVAFASGRFVSPNGTNFGAGVRGDLEATLAAILLDESQFIEVAAQSAISGKIQEPYLRFIRWVRAFDVSDFDRITRERLLGDNLGLAENLSMRFAASPSVFNFYRPGYVAPNTASGDQGLTTPEFQLLDATSAVGYANFMHDFVTDRSSVANFCPSPSTNFPGTDPCNNDPQGPSFTPDYSIEIALADDAPALVDHLDLLLTGSTMTVQEKQDIINAMGVITVRIGTNNEAGDRLDRVHTAVLMTVLGPSFIIVK